MKTGGFAKGFPDSSCFDIDRIFPVYYHISIVKNIPIIRF